MLSNSTSDSRLTGRRARKKLTHTDVSTSVTVAFASVGSAQHRCAFHLDCPPIVPNRAAPRSVELESVSHSPVTPRTRPENRSERQRVEWPLSPRRHQAQDLCVSYTQYGTNQSYGQPDWQVAGTAIDSPRIRTERASASHDELSINISVCLLQSRVGNTNGRLPGALGRATSGGPICSRTAHVPRGCACTVGATPAANGVSRWSVHAPSAHRHDYVSCRR